MSPHIIELSDHNICVSNSDAILAFEPGFANIAHSKPLFGEQAQQQSRLHPRQSFNQFWSQLNLDPLVNNNDHFRHQADLAYAHLNELANTHNIDGDVIFAVPSNYNRNQLAILLGLVKQCSFNAIGLVDLAVLKTAHLPLDKNKPALFIDIQLHQTILTTLENKNGLISKGLIQQIPGAGLIALHDAWANMISDEFINQSRFDPQHNAETEQYVYNQLGTWLTEVSAKNELLINLNNKGAIHQARLNLSSFEQRVKSIISRITEEMQSFAADDSMLIINKSMATLPGLSSFQNLITIEQDQLINNSLSNLKNITSAPESISLVTSLPLNSIIFQKKPSTNTEKNKAVSTHILVNHQAHALPSGNIYLGPIGGCIDEDESLFIELSDSNLNALITISNEGGKFTLEFSPKLNLSLNNQVINESSRLLLGDSISLDNYDLTLKLIQVK